jgi:hypothetical protein
LREARSVLPWRKRLWRLIRLEARLVATCLLFSVVSAFSIGYKEFTVGQWIGMLTTREYTLKAKGWVRTIAGVQAIVSVYLFALWLVAFFGDPFD